MRDIKFRAWDAKIKKMIYSDDFDYLSFFWIETELNNLCENLMQYTGLKDKNGKDIFEGDIVKYKTFFYGNEKEHIKEINWDEWNSDDFGEPHNAGYFNISNGMEVIGNIYENHDLLEGKVNPSKSTE